MVMIEMVKKIKIFFPRAKLELTADLFETPTTQKFWELLPIKSEASLWGEEVYYGIPLTLPLEPDAHAEMEVGDIGYWNVGKAMCLFFGQTPASKGNKPVAASKVNLYGKIDGDAKVLAAVEEGDEVRVEKL